MKRLSATLAASILAITMIAGQSATVFAEEVIYQETESEIVETTTYIEESQSDEELVEEVIAQTEEISEELEDTVISEPENIVESSAELETIEESELTEITAETVEETIAEAVEETTAEVVEETIEEVVEETIEEIPAETSLEETEEEITEEEQEESEEILYAGGVLEDGVEYVFAYKNQNGELIAISVVEGSVVGKKISGYSDADDNSKWTAIVGNKGAALCNKGTGSYLYYDKAGSSLIVGAYSSKSSWGFSGGDLGYTGGADTYYAAAVEDGSVVSYGKNSAVSSYVIVTASGENTGGEAESSSSSTGDTSSSTITYNETSNLDTFAYVSLVNPKTGIALKLDMNAFQSATTTVTGDAGSRTASAAKGTSIQVKKVGDGYALLMSDPPGTWNFIHVDGGTLAKDSDSTAEEKYNKWNLDADGHLYYDDNGTKYYLNSDGTVGTEYDGVSILLGGTEAASAGGGGGKGGNSIVSKIKADGPQVVNHPEATNVEYEGTGYEAPRYSTTAALPEGSTATSITFKWYVNNTLVATNIRSDAVAGAEITDVFQADQLKGVTAGVYPVYCEVSCTIAGEDGTETEYTNTAATVNFIVCKGIRSNTALTFSDVHEGFDSIGTAISNVMGDEGLIPALIICTGDWANGHYSGAELDSEGYNTTLNTFISRLKGQAGGIDTVFVSGNHDSGEAAITASIDADLGAAEDYDGVGVIYDSDADTDSVGTSEADDGLIVFGINYENIEGENGTDYDNIYDDLATFLSDLRDDYAGQLVVISAHAGLHQLEDWGGEAAYNINNANKIVALLNEYAETGMNILYMFGHNHSKGESELALVPGDEITTVISYTDKTTETVPISFAYGHAGYLLQGTGSGAARYSLISWDTVKDTFTKDVYGVTDGTKIDDLSYTVEDDKLIVHDFTFTEGNGSKWTGDANGLKFEVNGNADTFTSLKIDGKEVDPKDYTIAKGCTEITLSAAYLKQLASGETPHTIEANYESGSAVAAFFVDNKVEEVKPAEPESKTEQQEVKPAEPETKANQPEVKPADGNKPAGGDKPAMGPNSDIPKTGDTNNALIWIIIMVACAACIVTVFTCLIRRNRKNR